MLMARNCTFLRVRMAVIFFFPLKTPRHLVRPEALNDNVNSTFSENSVSISPDGNTLYFSSDRPITSNKTDLDLYVSRKDRNGKWGAARNLGPTINTPYDEDGPFIDYDGKTLYFSSKGHNGMGWI
jgi:Tol biopolymer transport system component